MPNNYKKKKPRSKKGGTTIRSPNRSRLPTSPILPIEPTPLVRQNAERFDNLSPPRLVRQNAERFDNLSPPRLVRQYATYNFRLNNRSNSPPPRLVRQYATYNFRLNNRSNSPPPRLERQFSENRYIIANHNDTGNNGIIHHAERFMRNLIIDNLYRINNTNHRNETTYGFRMVNNEPVRIMQNVNTGALRNDYSFFVRRNSPPRH